MFFQISKKNPKKVLHGRSGRAVNYWYGSWISYGRYKPYVNTIATFLTRRCFEQVCIDLCLHDLPVRLIENGGGLVYAPLGPTHQATDDISIMRTIPNLKIIAP